MRTLKSLRKLRELQIKSRELMVAKIELNEQETNYAERAIEWSTEELKFIEQRIIELEKERSLADEAEKNLRKDPMVSEPPEDSVRVGDSEKSWRVSMHEQVELAPTAKSEMTAVGPRPLDGYRGNYKVAVPHEDHPLAVGSIVYDETFKLGGVIESLDLVWVCYLHGPHGTRIKAPRKRIVHWLNHSSVMLVRVGDVVEFNTGMGLWGVVTTPRSMGSLTGITRFLDQLELFYRTGEFFLVSNPTRQQLSFSNSVLHEIKTTPEPNQSDLRQVQPTPNREGGVSEGEECGYPQTPDDIHGHPGLFRGQREGSLYIGYSTPASVYFGVDGSADRISRNGLHAALLSSGEFANYESWTHSLHR